MVAREDLEGDLGAGRMKPMNTLRDVVEEAKVRTVFWAICVFGISYFLTHTSKSMCINIPISVLILAAFRYVSHVVELRWRVMPVRRVTYLSHLEKKQLPVDDPRLSYSTCTSRWRKKIDSPLVEMAIDDFINKILQDFVVDLWYSSVTPDKEAPELIRALILDALGEISGRIKELNLVELLTRDMVDLIGNQLDLYRKSQSQIGVDILGTLSFEERDERLKRHMMASRELHPALMSPEFEHKVLQRMVGGILAVVLRPKEAQCPLVRCLSRELLTCLVVQPVMNFASPVYINELIEYILLNTKDSVSTDTASHRLSEANYPAQGDKGPKSIIQTVGPEHSTAISSTLPGDLMLSKNDGLVSCFEHGKQNMLQEGPLSIQPQAAGWALVLEAATKRRTQVLAPENLENMWTKGRNYKKKTAKLMQAKAVSGSDKINSVTVESNVNARDTKKESSIKPNKSSADLIREQPSRDFHSTDGPKESTMRSVESTSHIKRSNSTPDMDTSFASKSGENIIYKDYYGSNISKHKEEPNAELVSHGEGPSYVPKLKCRVVGAYFENLGAKSFAVYSIAVTDTESKTWFVKRRYRNFERLHRHLKDIRNYSLSLPPKRFLSSSIDDYFVHQRCILLDKYLQDLLSIANIAEQHEVWDFLSASSKNYSFGKSTSVMKTLAVNVDDAMDDIVRQIKRKVVGPSPALVNFPTQAEHSIALPWNDEETKKHSPTYSNMETSQSISEDDVHDEDHSSALAMGWHSDNELKGLPPRIMKLIETNIMLSQKSEPSELLNRIGLVNLSTSDHVVASDPMGDLARVPPEWTPPNVSVPILNLVDNVFQLNRRGWLRRQVFWISKQILQLIMEDAIDDWILRQIHLLRNDERIAHGIRWVQDILWPNGTFFIKFGSAQEKTEVIDSNKSSQTRSQKYSDKVGGPSSFELQLEAARRASDVKKMILGGAPTALVSLIGHRQYRRCAKDVYYFLQSSVCLKQLGYNMLELVIVSVFPELRDLIMDIHQKSAC